MKIKTKILTNFLKKARMSGSDQIEESVIKFSADGLHLDANSAAKQSRIMAWLKKNAFEEYEELGNIGMNDLSNVVKVLDRFGEIITIKKEVNVLNIKGDGKSVEIELVNEGFLDTDTAEPSLEFTDTFDIKATKLADIIKDVQMNKDAVLNIKTAPKSVMFSNTGKYKFNNTLEATMCKGGVDVKFGQPFIDATNELDGVLQISVRTDYPCKVIEKLENSTISIIIAPRVVTEE